MDNQEWGECEEQQKGLRYKTNFARIEFTKESEN
jgi:hypothetical protein